MRNDWRTDNWAGNYPTHIDPRNYRFARHLREFDHYATYNFDGVAIEEDIDPLKLFVFAIVILTILANLNIIIDVLTHIQDYYTMWVDSVLDLKQDLHK